MRSFACVLVALGMLGACNGKSEHPGPDSLLPASRPTAAQPTIGPARAACPATGQWTECAIFDRLDHAGLAPRRDSSAQQVELPPLSQRGTRLLIGSAELDIFIFDSPAAREREEARLDRSKFIEATDEPTLRGEATLIRNANLLAVLRSRNDHQRERVSDALSAGPPQPTGAASLPPTRSPR